MIWPDLLATLVGAVAAFAFGALYYGLLGKPWMRAARIDPQDAKMSAGLFATTFALSLVLSAGVGWFLATVGIVNSLPSAVIVTAILWLTVVLPPMAVNHRYQGFGWSLTAIDGIHWLAAMEIMAVTHILMAGAPKILG